MGLLAGKPDGSPEARRLLAFHLAYMVLGLVAALPIGSWSARAYVMALRITITGMAYKIYLMHGLPSIRPMSAIMVSQAPVCRPACQARQATEARMHQAHHCLPPWPSSSS